jgi:hypothetical protein
MDTAFGDTGRFVRRSAVRYLVLAVAFLLLATFASAQVIKGSISGSVVDQSGAVVSGAQVKATQAATNQTFTTVTDSSGLFRLSLLPIGSYTLSVTAPGFQTLAQSGLQVTAGSDRATGPLQLTVGAPTETVEVTAAPPLVEATQAQITSSFGTTTLDSFAGVRENQGLDNLALFVPGVSNVRDNGFSNTNGVGFSVNGLRGRNNDQQIDGQNNNDNSVGGPSLFLSNPEFVDEYQIVTDNFGPEYGRNSGSVVNILTKSGTNKFHGSVYGTESNSALNTRDNIMKRFQEVNKVPQFNDEFAGGTIGGPVLKNRMFFFAGFDQERYNSNSVFSTGSLTPTPTGVQQLSACFPTSTSVQALAKYGPYAITGGNPVPSGTVTTQAVGTCPAVEFAGVQRSLAYSNRVMDVLGKVDFAFDKDRISTRYVWQNNSWYDTGTFGTALAAAGYPASVPGHNQQAALSWTHTFTDRMVNELRVNYGRLNAMFGTNTIGNTVPGTGNIGDALTNIAFSDPSLVGFGPSTTAPQGRIVNTWQIQDNWSYIKGKHTIKAGVNWTYQRSPNTFLPNLNGQFRFADWTAFANNTPNRISITLGDPKLDFREYDTFLYAGDDWKITSNFTLNLGLTWSYYGQPANLFYESDLKRESNPDTAFFDPALPLDVRIFPHLDSPKSSFGPSIGFAYQPNWGGWLTGNGKMVMRGGYRLAYDPPFYNIYLNISSSAPQVLAQTISGATAAGIPMLADPVGTAVRAQLQPYLTPGVADPRSFNQTSVAPNFGPDRVHSWSFGIQRELVKDAVVEVRYVGNHGEHLFQSIDGNPYIADLAANYPQLVSGMTPCSAADAVVPQAVGRVDCNRGIVRERTNTGYSDYNGLQTEFRTTRLFKQLTGKVNYTFSKTTDNASEIFGTFAAGGTTAFSQDPLNYTTAEHGLSGLDVTNNFAIALTEELPFHQNQVGTLGRVLGGWVLSGTYQIATGQPYTPVQYFLNAGVGGPNYSDTAFMGAFNSSAENLRPFWGNRSAPATSVGMFAGDACSYFGTAAICGTAPTQLLDFAAANAAYSAGSADPAAVPVTQDQVRYVVNSPMAQAYFGSPFGNVGRNVARTAGTNVMNFSLGKRTKVTESTSLEWHMTVLNIFNHNNYGLGGGASIDPFLDDAGLVADGTGFANPSLWSGSPFSTTRGRRQISFGLTFRF